MIENKDHMYHLVKYGVFFGYSVDSIIEFVNNFGNAYHIIDGKLYDYRTKGATNGTGHMCSWYEAITLSYDDMVNEINANRYCEVPFPWDDNIPFDKPTMDKEVNNLFNTNFNYRKKVENIVQYIFTNLDISLKQE